MKINIELMNGKIVGIYGSDPNVEVKIFEDLNITDEQEGEMELEIAATPHILYQPAVWC